MEENLQGKVSMQGVYALSQDVVAREIAGEIVIVPLVSGIGNLEDELFSLNKTGRLVWERLDGKKELRLIVEELSKDYAATEQELAADVQGFCNELLKRKMIVEVKGK